MLVLHLSLLMPGRCFPSTQSLPLLPSTHGNTLFFLSVFPSLHGASTFMAAPQMLSPVSLLKKVLDISIFHLVCCILRNFCCLKTDQIIESLILGKEYLCVLCISSFTISLIFFADLLMLAVSAEDLLSPQET